MSQPNEKKPVQPGGKSERIMREKNKVLALTYARIGFAIMPVKIDKSTPCIAFGKLADAMSEETKENEIADYQARNKTEWTPKFVGSTRNPDKVLEMFKDPDVFAFGINMGLNGLYVVDPDKKNNGPELIENFWQSNGGVPNGSPRIG